MPDGSRFGPTVSMVKSSRQSRPSETRAENLVEGEIPDMDG